MNGSEYDHLYALKNVDTGKWVFTYTASSQKHKALFSSHKKAEDASRWFLNEGINVRIVEL